MTVAAAPTKRTLGDLVAERPAAAGILEALRLDYCCGGKQTLDEACAERGLDPDTVLALVAAADRLPAAPTAGAHDLADASPAELCGHLVERHHEPARRMLARAGELLDTVNRVHGTKRPQLADLRAEFVAMRAELEGHMAVEESTLFPACAGLGEGTPARELEELISEHEGEHTEVGTALARLRELGDDYDEATALCNTHRALLRTLRELEEDTHVHVHEENNILFPRVRDQLTATA